MNCTRHAFGGEDCPICKVENTAKKVITFQKVLLDAVQVCGRAISRWKVRNPTKFYRISVCMRELCKVVSEGEAEQATLDILNDILQESGFNMDERHKLLTARNAIHKELGL